MGTGWPSQRCSGSAATEQDLCITDIATSKVNWATSLDCVIKPQTLDQVSGGIGGKGDPWERVDMTWDALHALMHYTLDTLHS